MPNTLAHLGVQGAASHGAGPTIPVHWVIAGVVIPDLPWILYRVVRGFGLPFDPYELRLYAIVQSSLLFSLALGIALVLLLARRRLVAGAVVTGNLLLHLLLDGLQRKWGNGVTLLAPADWSQWSLDLFWPEGPVAVIGTAVGIGYCVYMARVVRRRGAGVVMRTRPRALLPVLGLLVAYVAGPLAFTGSAEVANNHYIATLRDRSARAGRPVEFDRVTYHPTDPPSIATFAGERIYLGGLDSGPDRAATASVRGEFVAVDAVDVADIHYHWPWFREVASVIGLLAGAAVWLVVLIRGPAGRAWVRAFPQP